MKKIIITFLFTLAAVAAANAQHVSSSAINPDTRSSAMGDIKVALTANQFSVFNNTAAIALTDTKAAIGYSFTWRTASSTIKNHNLQALGGFYKINKRHAIAAGVRYFSTPKQDRLGDNGERLGTLKPYDLMIDLGYTFTITDYLGVSANVRFIQSSVDLGDDNAFAADLGLFFSKNRWNAALTLNNIGSKVQYFPQGTEENMPTFVRLGASRDFILGSKHKLTAGLESAYMFFPSDYSGFEGGVGIEYMYDNLLAVRGGYRIGDEKTTGNGYGTVGLGLHHWGFMLDASYMFGGKSKVPARSTVKISLGYKF